MFVGRGSSSMLIQAKLHLKICIADTLKVQPILCLLTTGK